ncbi:MAG: SDR family NAD(P)-dependent oxidoreductase [Lacunisphaera sp.]
MSSYKFVNFSWDDAKAAALDPVARLVYRSNLLGGDQRITNTGGGNTSSKLTEKDPLSGAPSEVLWVKGSGGDLRTSTRENFSSLYQDKLIALQKVYAARADKGLKAPRRGRHGRHVHAHDVQPEPARVLDRHPAPLLPPGKHVDHMHPNAIIAIAASANCVKLTQEIFGGKMAYVPWMRPGFELGLAMQEIAKQNPGVQAIMMGQHGFISWDNDDKACYTLTLDFIEQAAAYIEAKYAAKGGDATAFGGAKYQTLDADKRRAVPRRHPPVAPRPGFPREALHRHRPGRRQDPAFRELPGRRPPRRTWHELPRPFPPHEDQAALRRLEPAGRGRRRAEGQAGPRTRELPQGLRRLLRKVQTRQLPGDARPEPDGRPHPGRRHGRVGQGQVRVPRHRRILQPAPSKSCVAPRRSTSTSPSRSRKPSTSSTGCSKRAKLKRMPAEKELARQIVIVVGAGSGIGKETAHRLVKEGAHIVTVDLNEAAAQATAKEIESKYGVGIGVAGTGLSNCGPAIGLAANITDRASIRHMLDGRRDRLRRLRPHLRHRRHLRAVRHHRPHSRRQVGADLQHQRHPAATSSPTRRPSPGRNRACAATSCSTTSANAAVAKKGSLAYDTSKAAANHLVRELAIELAPLVRVNGVAPPRPSSRAPRCSPATASSARWPSTTSPTKTMRPPTRW